MRYPDAKPYPKTLEEWRWYKQDWEWEPPTPEQVDREQCQVLIDCTIDSIAELAEDIGFLVKLRRGMTDIDALGKIAQLIDLNQTMIRDYQDELIGQKAAYKLD